MQNLLLDGQYELLALETTAYNVEIWRARMVSGGPELRIYWALPRVEGNLARHFHQLGMRLCQLTHDGMPEIVDFGDAGARPYLVAMVEADESLAAWWSRHPALPARLRLLAGITDLAESLGQDAPYPGYIDPDQVRVGIDGFARLPLLPASMLAQCLDLLPAHDQHEASIETLSRTLLEDCITQTGDVVAEAVGADIAPAPARTETERTPDTRPAAPATRALHTSPGEIAQGLQQQAAGTTTVGAPIHAPLSWPAPNAFAPPTPANTSISEDLVPPLPAFVLGRPADTAPAIASVSAPEPATTVGPVPTPARADAPPVAASAPSPVVYTAAPLSGPALQAELDRAGSPPAVLQAEQPAPISAAPTPSTPAAQPAPESATAPTPTAQPTPVLASPVPATPAPAAPDLAATSTPAAQPAPVPASLAAPVPDATMRVATALVPGPAASTAPIAAAVHAAPLSPTAPPNASVADDLLAAWADDEPDELATLKPSWFSRRPGRPTDAAFGALQHRQGTYQVFVTSVIALAILTVMAT